ncbi:MAG: hypothetical protein WGP72_24065, partial [Klebsiella quasipneumoniae]
FNQRVSLGRNDLLIRTFPFLISSSRASLGAVWPVEEMVPILVYCVWTLSKASFDKISAEKAFAVKNNAAPATKAAYFIFLDSIVYLAIIMLLF